MTYILKQESIQYFKTILALHGDQLLDMLRDRLVCGLTSERMQRRLLSEPNLTFENAFLVATAMETADKNASKLQTQFSTAGGEHSYTKMATEQVNKIGREKAKIDCWYVLKTRFKDMKFPLENIMGHCNGKVLPI